MIGQLVVSYVTVFQISRRKH